MSIKRESAHTDKEEKMEKIKEILETIRKRNPYPEDIFIKPTKTQYKKMREAFYKAHLSPDAFFGSFGREVWNFCIKEILTQLEEQLSDI